MKIETCINISLLRLSELGDYYLINGHHEQKGSEDFLGDRWEGVYAR